MRDVISRTGVSKPSVYRLMEAGQFPRSRRYRSLKGVFWLEDEVEDWKCSQALGLPRFVTELLGSD